jgi:WD40 repeat protein
MGVVYKARQLRLNRLVALKMILASDQATPEQVIRFGVEAETVAQLAHPNIVQIYEIGTHAGRPYFALEYVAGGSLAKQLAGRPQPARDCAALVEVLARAMQHAHELGIVHRDLKPANILLQKDEGGRMKDVSTPDPSSASSFILHPSSFVPKVADFGLARLLHVDLRLTATDVVAGTPAYMAPEQMQGGRPDIGPATDVYALGAILYEMLTGRPPFVGSGPPEVLRQVVEQDPLPPSRLAGSVPRDLETICLKCLEKEPARRYATARALAEDCAAFLRGEPITARPASLGQRAVKWARRRPAVAGLLAALVLLAGLGFGLVFWQWERAEVNATNEARARRDEHTAREAAEAEARNAQTQLVHQRVAHYALQLAQVQGELRRGAPLWAEELLGRTPPDLRDWEYHYLRAQCRRRVTSLGKETPEVYAVAYGPGGKLLAASERGGLLRVWDTATGEQRLAFPANQGTLMAFAFSPDGQRLASAGVSLNVNVWDVSTGRLVVTLRHPSATWYRGLAFRPDGGGLAGVTGFAGQPGQVLLWDLAAADAPRTFEALPGPGTCVCFDADGRRLASGCADGTVRVWDPAQARPVRTITAHDGSVDAVVFSPDGQALATLGPARLAKVHSLATGQEVFRGEGGGGETLSFSADGRRLSAGGAAGVKEWDLKTGRAVLTRDGLRDEVEHAVVSPDGLRLAAAGPDRRLKVWALEPWLEARSLRVAAGIPAAVAFGPGGRQLVACDGGGVVSLWETDTGRPLGQLPAQGSPLWGIACTPSGGRIAFATRTGPAGVWAPDRGNEVQWLGGPRDVATAVAYHPSGQHLAVGGETGAVQVWDLAAGKVALALEGNPGSVSSLAISPDGSRLAAAGRGDLCVWDLANGRPLWRVPGAGPGKQVRAVGFNADGSRLASCGDDGLIFVWDAGGVEVLRLAGHGGRLLDPRFDPGLGGQVLGLAFHPNGKRLASCGLDRTVRLWDMTTGQEILTLLERAAVVHGVAFSPDGRRLAAACDDRTIRIWDSAP